MNTLQDDLFAETVRPTKAALKGAVTSDNTGLFGSDSTGLFSDPFSDPFASDPSQVKAVSLLTNHSIPDARQDKPKQKKEGKTRKPSLGGDLFGDDDLFGGSDNGLFD